MVIRRMFLTTLTMIAMGLIAACANNTTPAPTPSNPVVGPAVLTDAQTVVGEAHTIVTLVDQVAPGKIKPAVLEKIKVADTAATALLVSLSDTTPAPVRVATLKQIDGYINTILDVAGPVLTAAAGIDPALEPAVIAYDLILPLMPELETGINSLLATTKIAVAAPRSPIHTQYTPDQARATAAALPLATWP